MASDRLTTAMTLSEGRAALERGGKLWRSLGIYASLSRAL